MDFCLELCKDFKDFANDGEGFLTTSECERIVYMGLERIKPHEDGTVPGYSDVKLYRNRATSKLMHIIFIFASCNVLISQLNKMEEIWGAVRAAVGVGGL